MKIRGMWEVGFISHNYVLLLFTFVCYLVLKHHFLTPLQDAAPHVQSKQHLKLFLIISESVDCLVCSDEDLRPNILTDFASINWLTVSIHIYISFCQFDCCRNKGCNKWIYCIGQKPFKNSNCSCNTSSKSCLESCL